MANVKKRSNDIEHREANLPSKRQRFIFKEQNCEIAAVDPATGQRSAFPGLGEEKRELFFGPASNGLDYLKMVRSESRFVPYVFAATNGKHANYNESCDLNAFYSDGAYTASPQKDNNGANDQFLSSNRKDSFETYHHLLIQRFLTHQTSLKFSPPPYANFALDELHPTSLTPNNRKSFSRWVYLLRHTDPHPAQLAVMGQETILKLISLIISTLKCNKNIEPRSSTWIWGLLGRLQPVGCLISEQVAVVRELGKRAAWVATSFNSSSAKTFNQETDEVLKSDLTVADGNNILDLESHFKPSEVQLPIIDDSIPTSQILVTSTNAQSAEGDYGADTDESEIPKTLSTSSPLQFQFKSIDTDQYLGTDRDSLIQNVHHLSELGGSDDANTLRFPSINTKATIDTIIFIVGDLYGQRDLLQFEGSWHDTGIDNST
ncbi:MAG: hypothetical protein M1829_004632 [Trizodia sp. TS-e1964]|nr:MAG: hypothetical protein M1829_004632 [Trizodia sp. TS-e1964]